MTKDEAQRLTRLETKFDEMASDVAEIKDKLSNGLSIDVALLKKDRDNNKYWNRTLIGILVIMLLTQVFSILFKG